MNLHAVTPITCQIALKRSRAHAFITDTVELLERAVTEHQDLDIVNNILVAGFRFRYIDYR